MGTAAMAIGDINHLRAPMGVWHDTTKKAQIHFSTYSELIPPLGVLPPLIALDLCISISM